MVRAKSKSMAHSEDHKQRILLSARKIFAKKGYHGTNLKDVAQQAGVANSLINYYFRNKDDLFKQTIDLFAQDRMSSILRLLTQPQSREELRVRIQLFVDEMLRSYISDPDGYEMIHNEIKNKNKIALQHFRETFLLVFDKVRDFFKQAQDLKLMSEKHDPLIVAMLLFSSTCDTAQNDHLGELFYSVSLKNDEWREKVTQHIVDLFMNGVVE